MNNKNDLSLIVNLASKPGSLKFNLCMEFFRQLLEGSEESNSDLVNLCLKLFIPNYAGENLKDLSLVVEYQALSLLLATNALTDSYPYKEEVTRFKELLSSLEKFYNLKIYYCQRSLDDLNYNWNLAGVEPSYLLYQDKFDFGSPHAIMEF